MERMGTGTMKHRRNCQTNERAGTLQTRIGHLSGSDASLNAQASANVRVFITKPCPPCAFLAELNICFTSITRKQPCLDAEKESLPPRRP